MKRLKKTFIVFALIFVLCACPAILFACQKSPKLELVQSFKTTYYVGEKLDLIGGIIKYTDEDGEATTIAIREDMVTVFSTEKPGNRKLIITYRDKTCLVDYTVLPYDVKENVYYWDGEHDFFSFDKTKSIFKYFYIDNPSHYNFSEGFPEPEMTMPITKGFDEDGNIVYTAFNGDVKFCEINNITKDSFMFCRSESIPFLLTVCDLNNF